MGPRAYFGLGLLGCLLVGPFTDGLHEGCHLPDWLNIQGRCYGYLSEKVSWHQGQVRCGNYGGDLASLENDEDYEAVASFLRKLGVYEDTWVEEPLKKDQSDEIADLCPALDNVSGFLQRRYAACSDRLSFLCETKSLK